MFERATPSNAAGGQTAGILRSTLHVVILHLLAKGSLFVLHAGLAVILGAGEYGKYVYLVGFYSFLSTFSLFGLESSAVHLLPKYRVRGEELEAASFIKAAFLVVLAGTIFLAGSLTFLPFGSAIFPLAYEELGKSFSLLIPIFALVALSTGILQAYQCYIVPILLWKILLPLVLLGACWGITRSYVVSASLLLTLHTFFAVLMALGFGMYIWKKWWSGRDTERISSSSLRSLGVSSWPFYEMSILQFLLSQADLLVAGFFLDAAQVGVYGVVTRLAQLLSFAILAANVPLAPKISETSDTEELQKLVSSSLLVVLLLTLPMIIGLVIFGEPLLGMFGAEYRAGYGALIVASAGQLLISFQGSVGTILQMRGHAATAARIVRYAALLNIILAIILIPLFGIIGAALASALAVSSRSYLLLREVRSRVGVHASIFGLLPYFKSRGRKC